MKTANRKPSMNGKMRSQSLAEERERYEPGGGRKKTPDCRPSMNGNPPEHFRKAGQLIYTAAGNAIDEIGAALSCTEVFNGRNYQHMPTEEGNAARDADLAEIREAYAAMEKLRNFSLEIYKLGEE